MDNSFVNALLSQPHLPSPVFCYADATVETIAKKVCACLNEAGGWIVVGVNADHHSVSMDAPTFAKNVQKEITEGILPLPLVYVQQDVFENKVVVLITIPKGSLTPYTYRARYYVLQGEEPAVATNDYLARLLRDSSAMQSAWERINNLYANEEDLDERLMSDVYDKGLSLGRLSKSSNGLRGLLSELHLLRTSEMANGTVALFARETKGLLPQCRLRIQLMSRGKIADQYDDLYFIEGNIFNVQKEAISYFKERLPRVAYFFKDRAGRYNDFEYPIDVLDEAISNALIHRDYEDISDEVTVFIYTDRIEITNSGVLPDNLVSGKSRVLPHGSVLRNPLMAEIFYVAGEMEKTGRGMYLISNTMKEAGRKLPEWLSANGKTTLMIYSKKEELTINERIRYFLSCWETGKEFTRTDYMDSFEKKPSKGTVQNDLLLMLKLGLTEKSGAGPSTKYRIK